MNCVACQGVVVGKAVLLQEDARTTIAEEKEGNFDGWKGMPIGENGMHFMLFHPTHFLDIFDKLMELEKKVSCMFYIGDVADFIDALEDEGRKRPW